MRHSHARLGYAPIWTTHFGPVDEFISISVLGGDPVAPGSFDEPPWEAGNSSLITPTNVYWASNTGIQSLSRSTRTVTTLVSGPIWALAQDSACLYWLDNQQLITKAK